MLSGRKPNIVEQKWLDFAFQIPCLVCSLYHDEHDSPSEYHHIKGKHGAEAHLNGLSLCDKHHRISDTQHPKRWISRHGDGRSQFESRYAPEFKLLAEQQRRVNALKRQLVGEI